MTADRILSQHGNVIAADFRPSLKITVTLTTEMLYCDGRVTLIRSIAIMDGKPIAVTHALGDHATGNVTTL